VHWVTNFFLTDKFQKDLEFHSAVGILQRGPKRLKITTWPLTITTNPLTRIASKQSRPCFTLMAGLAVAVPPQFQSGKKPLGWMGGFDVAEAGQKDLTKRRELAQSNAARMARPSMWPQITVAGKCCRGGSVVES
jgi:hypothetical protein